jgi:eukaryotic-like serine/threonine-protein kinase
MRLIAQDWSILSPLLSNALEMDESERARYLRDLRASDARIADLLARLLAADARAKSGALPETMPKLPAANPCFGGLDEAVARQGDLIGAYRLLYEIGRGGMGNVWLAERADGTFKRQVALKLPRLVWGAGLVARMARERDIGALLEHPNVARLYDAGVDDRGRPYLAMEFVDGQSIDAWCNAQSLDVAARLRLFVQVARAVAYAHGRLVVHRDLKPSNVLVTSDGQAHLLDFGIAKLLDEATPEGVGLTQQQERVMTPHYASPEQVAGESITVQSDVYSLGVLLYELLTGTLPIVPKRNSLGAVEDAILQGDAPLASSRVQDRTAVKALRGEVDAILAKAMQREPARRYNTADAMAQDIERHLSGDTVSAQPDSRTYRLRKALRRHWVIAAAVIAVMLAVLIGSSVAVEQARRATQAAERARVVKEFVTEVFRVNIGAEANNARLRQLPAEQLLAHGAQLIESRFPQQPELRAELLGVVGEIYAHMGAFRLAADFAKRELDIRRELNPSPGEHVKVLLRLSEALLNDSDYASALKYVSDALRAADGDELSTYDALVLHLRCQMAAGQLEPARITLRRAQGLERRVDVANRKSRAWAMHAQAMMLSHDGLGQESNALSDQAIDHALQVDGPASLVAAQIRIETAIALMTLNRWEEARIRYEPALAVLKSSGPAGEARALAQSSRIEWMLVEFGRQSAVDGAKRIGGLLATLLQSSTPVPAELLADVEFRLTWAEVMGGNFENAQNRIERNALIVGQQANRRALTYWVILAADVADNADRHADAEALGRKALALRLETGAGGVQFAIVSHVEIVRSMLMGGRFDAADAYLDAMPQPAPMSGDFYSNTLMEARAWSRLERGDASGALRILADKAERAVNPNSILLPPRNPTVTRGVLWCRLGQHTRGLDLLEKAIAFRSEYVFPYDPGLAWLRAQTGQCALQAKHRADAVRLARLSREAFTRQNNVSQYYKAPLRELEVSLGLKLPSI